jgi:hypothetical protein
MNKKLTLAAMLVFGVTGLVLAHAQDNSATNGDNSAMSDNSAMNADNSASNAS